MAPGGAATGDERSPFDDLPCAIARTTEDGTLLRVNQPWCDLVGRSREELVGRKRFQDLLTVGGRLFHQTHWAPLMVMQGAVSEVKLEVRHRDGSTVPIVLNAVRHDDGGEVVHDLAAFVARDRNRYERELVESRKRLAELVEDAKTLEAAATDRALLAEQMIGIVSHDLRNPIAAIDMAASRLARGQLATGQERGIAQIVRATDRAKRLIADLLDFTQTRLGKGLSIRREAIDLTELVADTLDELALVYPNRQLRHVAQGTGSVDADPNRISQVIGNLVSNAMSYGSTDGPVTVTSTLTTSEASIAVHNEGPPIPEEAHESLFRAMTQAAQAHPSSRSIGLGLFIVSQIAEAHRGAVSVRSTHDDGTTFTVTIPRHAVRDAEVRK